MADFDPSAYLAERKSRSAPATVKPSVDWDHLYSGLDNVTTANPEAFSSLDRIGSNNRESQAQAINQQYVREQAPALSRDILAGHWDNVRDGFAKAKGYTAGEPITDSALYSKISKDRMEAQGEIKATDWFSTMVGRGRIKVGATMDWLNRSAWHLPEAPKDSPDIPSLGFANPAVLSGVYNSTFKPFIEGFSTPFGIALGAAGAEAYEANVWARRAMGGISGLFAAIMAKHVIQAAPETKRVLQDPKSTTQEKVEAAGDLFGSGAMAVFASLGAAIGFAPDAKGMAARLRNKSPAEAAKVLREEANTTVDLQAENAMNHAASQLESLQPEPIAEAPQKIEQAAIKDEAGNVFTGNSHAEIKAAHPNAEGEKGFVTQSGEFVDREQAAEIAKQAEQLTPEAAAENPDKLHSHQVANMALEAERPAAISASEKMIGIKNASVEAEMEAMGMEPPTRGEKNTWDAAVEWVNKTLSENPNAGTELVQSLLEKNRPITGNEIALILHERTRLSVEIDKVERKIIDAEKSGDQQLAAELEFKQAKLRDEFEDASNADVAAGTENSYGLSFRRMMMREDYSLANMERQFRAAGKGEALTDKEMKEVRRYNRKVVDAQEAMDRYLKAAKTRMEKGIKETRERIAKGDLEPKPRRHVVLDDEGWKLKAELERARQDFNRAVFDRKMSSRSAPERILDTLSKWRRGFLLSSPTTIGKLFGAATLRMAITPIEEAVGGAIGKLPVVSEVAKRAPREGGLNVKAEAKAVTEAITKGMKDAADEIRKGSSDLDVLFEQKRGAKMRMTELPSSVIDFFGHAHAALKSPVKRAEFSRSMEKRMAHAIANGVDVTDPAVQTKITLDAFKDAQRAIFMQDNRISSGFNRWVKAMEEVDKETKQVPLSGKVGATLMRTAFPIVRVPTNIAIEAAQYATGAPAGLVKMAMAMANGFDNLTPAQADLIMRDLKKGSIGAAVLALGFFGRHKIGGYYQEREKRKAGDVKAGGVRIFDTNIPSTVMHHPAMEVLQAGATAGRALESKIRGGPAGMDDAVWSAALGMAEQVPFARETTEMARWFNPNERSYAQGQLAKSILVPALVQWLAELPDRDAKGNKIKREQKDTTQAIQSGIPGLRQQLPRRDIIKAYRRK